MARAARDPEERIRERNMRLIIKAGIEIFARKGFDGTRIAEIAEASGLPKANVYYYFSSKEEIYTAIIAHLLASWDDALKYISPEREPAEAFELYIKAKLEYTRKNMAESRLFASEIIQGARFLSRKDREHIRQVTDAHVAVVEGWIAAGKMLPVDPRHLFIMLWASTQFYSDFEPVAVDALRKPRLKADDYEKAAATITETILRGILRQP
ncbi:TetR family transcriptional regulator C-terminal domain-containing protein (plasmid) [Ensifer adhaerens]|uniref:TetR family transcriptional regulator C-terminal domain-containing protein n=1 Tax=Ensifer adhaerens TaxID=106592 RepID=UPI0023A9EEBD|nr:TetR family transcriptional regulator C-terminal domain-containing protein [Ensifer adhaerens]WDZ79213.1 TetR family transcriptional regulator C-terminal domain-containing protein [Ensifer adhaerens]